MRENNSKIYLTDTKAKKNYVDCDFNSDDSYVFGSESSGINKSILDDFDENSKIFIPTSNKKIIALDAISGKLVWEFLLEDNSPRRGMIYYEKKQTQPAKIFFWKVDCLISKLHWNYHVVRSGGCTCSRNTLKFSYFY